MNIYVSSLVASEIWKLWHYGSPNRTKFKMIWDRIPSEFSDNGYGILEVPSCCDLQESRGWLPLASSRGEGMCTRALPANTTIGATDDKDV